MAKKGWKIIPRPLLETVLNNHAQHHRVHQPLFLHGPRGVGKTTLILNRNSLSFSLYSSILSLFLISSSPGLLDDWNKGPHVTGYVDFGHYIEATPWASFSLSPPPTLASLRSQLEHCLESVVQKGVRIGSIGSQEIFSTLNKWHGLNTALRRILQNHANSSSTAITIADHKVPTSVLWTRALFALSARSNATEIDAILGFNEKGKVLTLEEASYFREAMVSLRLAKKVIELQQGWRKNAIAHLNRTGGFSRSLANSSTDWPCLLLELLSAAAEIDHFQPKLVINNIDVLRNAMLTDDSTVSASMYHDSLLWRLISLGVNENCLPVILLTSDSYYSYRAFMDFGFPDIFISREWMVIAEVLGTNPRHLSELYALKENNYTQKVLDNSNRTTFEDIVDAYLAYLQAHFEVTVVNPAMESALFILQKFAVDAQNGRISKDKLRFGSAWRHPPHTDNPTLRLEWAKLQLIDFIQSYVNAEFGINYLADCSLEILDDPSATALVEVGLLYAQRDPSFVRPISRGIQRCLVRWLVQERMKMSFQKSLWRHALVESAKFYSQGLIYCLVLELALSSLRNFKPQIKPDVSVSPFVVATIPLFEQGSYSAKVTVSNQCESLKGAACLDGQLDSARGPPLRSSKLHQSKGLATKTEHCCWRLGSSMVVGWRSSLVDGSFSLKAIFGHYNIDLYGFYWLWVDVCDDSPHGLTRCESTESVEREREPRTLVDFLREDMDGVERGGRWRNLKERLGFKGMGCCGATWGLRASNMSVRDEDDEEQHQEELQAPPENSLDPACVEIPAASGMNLATALAAERHFRATQDSEGGIVGTTTTSETEGTTTTTPCTPSRVSLMRLLEEADGGDGESEKEKGEGSDGVCCVCMGRRKGAAFIPCGHTFCRVCSRELWLNRGSCPLCNRSIIEILDIF
ncbi:hypothetical protein HHK36_005704 [Tetracentron sinense]|uniref:RING-type domain-containing protein n=1 Tax=Tetracentron sinense TaxID=13715 RepID=A0A834ZUP9_TETSI|nr:hypothetical protein HHK36_005704 [Tetracentron sinense]